MLKFWYTSGIYFFSPDVPPQLLLLPVQQSSILQRTAASFASTSFHPRCIWIPWRGALEKLQVVSFQWIFRDKLNCCPTATSNTDSAHFLGDTTALLRGTIALPKGKQQPLSPPSVLSRSLFVFYCQIFSSIPFEMAKLHKLWRDWNSYASHLPLLEAWFAVVDISALGICFMHSMVLLLQVPFLCLDRDV